MAYWIVHQEIENLEVESYRKAANDLIFRLDNKIGHLYRKNASNADPKKHMLCWHDSTVSTLIDFQVGEPTCNMN
jgi:hypothetical protein